MQGMKKVNVLIVTNSKLEAQNNFERSVLKKQNLNELLKNDKYNLQKIIDSKLDLNKEYSVWGYNSNKKPIKISEDNSFILAFYKDKRFYSLYKVWYYFKSESISSMLWETNEWSNIVVIEKIDDIDISIKDFNLKMGFKEKNVIQGMTIYSYEKAEKFLDLIKLSLIKQTEFKFQVLNIQDKLYENKLNYTVMTLIRGEQKEIRNVLRQKNLLNHCSVCGQKYPDFCLNAAHIYKRVFLTEEEKRDISNVALPMCLFGCDVLWENGYVIVDEQRFIRKNSNKKILENSENIEQYLDNIINKKVLDYNEKNKIYFNKHREFHRTK